MTTSLCIAKSSTLISKCQFSLPRCLFTNNVGDIQSSLPILDLIVTNYILTATTDYDGAIVKFSDIILVAFTSAIHFTFRLGIFASRGILLYSEFAGEKFGLELTCSSSDIMCDYT